MPTGTGVGIVIRVTPSLNASATAGGSEQRGLTMRLQRWDVEPADTPGITLMIVESVSSPATGKDGRDGDGSVHADGTTISGTGSQADPFKVVTPYTATEKNKLAGINDNATDDQTAAEIKTALETLRRQQTVRVCHQGLGER